jgi:hypothetical protein
MQGMPEELLQLHLLPVRTEVRLASLVEMFPLLLVLPMLVPCRECLEEQHRLQHLPRADLLS